MKFSPEQQTIAKTLAYAQIFEYPLTAVQIFQRQVFSPKHNVLPQKWILDFLQTHPLVKVSQGWWFLRGHQHVAAMRAQREKWSMDREQELLELTLFLQKIPGIKAAYITGSLAMQNISHADDDIDVLIVTAKNSIWLTRLLLVPWAILKRKYRFHRSIRQTGWCFNLWLDEESLTMPIDRRSLYSAYEVVQARQILGQKNLLVAENAWVGQFLPAQQFQVSTARPHPQTFVFSHFIVTMLNWCAYQLQWLLMKKHHTIERIGLGYAFFHPRDTQAGVMKEYHALLRKFGVKA